MAALSHYGLLRGEDARGIQLPDVQHLPMEHREGPTQCDVMVILLLDGKTNQTGNTQYMGAMRNKEWEVCPLGAMAMWLFYRLVLIKNKGRREVSSLMCKPWPISQIPDQRGDVRTPSRFVPTHGRLRSMVSHMALPWETAEYAYIIGCTCKSDEVIA